MDDAQLHVSLGEYALYGIWESRKPVHAGNEDVMHTAVLKVGQNAEPEVGTFAPGNVHAKQVLAAFLVKGKHVVNGT